MKKLDFAFTSDRMIRTAIRANLEIALAEEHESCPEARIIEELGITHGAARIDIAVVNGVIHGYELKSDLDTLRRLPEQMREYNAVLDQVTLVVGKSHLIAAINIVPEWWGITIAKIVQANGPIRFYKIRDAGNNLLQNAVSVASLLWRGEALDILEEIGEARGMRSKNRRSIYERLAYVIDKDDLRTRVRQKLCARSNWRSDRQCMPCGD